MAATSKDKEAAVVTVDDHLDLLARVEKIETAPKPADLSGDLASLKGDVAGLLNSIGDIRKRPWHVLSDLPDIMDRLARLERSMTQLSQVLCAMFPERVVQLTGPKTEVAEGG